MLEGGSGTAATAHLCATFAELAWDTELCGPLLLTRQGLAEALVYRRVAPGAETAPNPGVAEAFVGAR